MPITHSHRDRAKKQFHLTEYWVNAYVEGKYNQPNPFPVNSTLKSLRMVDKDLGLDYAYTVWCTGEREIYDMTVSRSASPYISSPPPLTCSPSTPRLPPFPSSPPQTDPDQMRNLADSLSTLSPSSDIARLHTRLDALLLVLKTCAGDSCRYPWSTMFTNGKVKNIKDAMKKEYDDYFKSLPDVRYSVSSALDARARRSSALSFGANSLRFSLSFSSVCATDRGARWATTGLSRLPSGRTPSPIRPRSLTPIVERRLLPTSLSPSKYHIERHEALLEKGLLQSRVKLRTCTAGAVRKLAIGARRRE